MEGLGWSSLDMDVPADLSLWQFGEELNRLRAEISGLRRENQELRQHVGQLQTEVTHLRRANLELRQEAGYWQSRHRDAVRRISQLEGTVQQLEAQKRQQQSQFQEQIEQLEAQKRQLQGDLFGRRTEKHSHDGYGELADPLEQGRARLRGQQAGQPRPPRRDYSHLETRPEVIDLPSAERVCGQCGKPLAVLQGSEDSEVIEIEVGAYRRLVRRRRYRRTCTCPGQRTFTAPPAPKLIPKGRLGISVWVEILLDKYLSYRPTQRLLAAWGLLGLAVAPGTVTDGLKRLEPLFVPVYDALALRGRQQGTWYQGDETRWLVFSSKEGKENHCWWLWMIESQETVVYLLDPSRSRAVPQTYLPTDRTVVLLVDRLSSYKAMAQTKDGSVRLAFCWAHVRRDFIRVGKGWLPLIGWALAWLRRIRQLYRLNRQRREAGADATALAPRDAALREAVADMRTQAARQLADPQLHTACRKTLVSLQEHWQGLTRFVDDPRIPMDNNDSERRLRGPAVGRKNFYGSAAEWSGRLAAMLFSIFATLNLWKINPRHWLTWYCQHCSAAGGKPPETIESFLPWNLSVEQRETLGRPSEDSS